jgi:hypothetical protein
VVPLRVAEHRNRKVGPQQGGAGEFLVGGAKQQPGAAAEIEQAPDGAAIELLECVIGGARQVAGPALLVGRGQCSVFLLNRIVARGPSRVRSGYCSLAMVMSTSTKPEPLRVPVMEP